jgi:protein STU2
MIIDDIRRTRNNVIQPIYEKGLSSTRSAAKASALEALLLYVELDKSDPVIEELLPALSHKQPKIIAATLGAITAIFHNFGIKIVEPKPILKALPKAFGHADKNVRAEAQNLTAELYRWLREAMKPIFWGDLKPVQQQDLEKLFEAVKQEPPPKQERFTRAQQEAMAVKSGRGDEIGEEEEAADVEEEGGDFVEVDAFDLAEPVDVMSKVPKDFHESLASTKWKDRKDALDALYAIVNVPRIKDGSFDDIVRVFAKCMKDANVAVVTVAANCVEALAKGLRKAFAKYRSTIMSPIMERFKEKKQSVADALGAALDAVFATSNLTDCLEETLGFLTHKNPQVKLETLKFLIRCLRTTRDVPQKPEVKSIADAGTKALTESTEVMRAGGAEILGTLMKIMGERAMGPYLDGLDDIRKTKIKEFYETAEVKAKDRPKPVAPPPKAVPAAGKKVVGGKKPAAPGLKKPPTSMPQPAAETIAPSPYAQQARPAVGKSKLSAPKSGLTAPSGLKLGQKKLVGPGGAAPPHPMSSPQRALASPTEEEPPPSISRPKFGLAPPGRGLAGRTLSKPAPQSAEPSSPPSVHPALTAIERAELEELRADKDRAEKDRLTRQNEDLRTNVAKLQSQVHELQNQNAQLIEDHTRDVLSIKAKETQLVRARSDAEAAEQTVQKQQREMDRLKRELSRSVRATSPPPRTSIDLSGIGGDGIYRDSPSNGRPGSLGRFDSSASVSSQTRPRSYMLASPSEEKENSDGPMSRRPGAKITSTSSANPTSQSGRTSPSKMGRTSSTSRSEKDSMGASTDSATGGKEPAENWKRAAEVTSQLKARIEQMKVRYYVLASNMVGKC